MSSLTRAQRPPPGWATLGLLSAWVATNAALLALLRTGGPLIGLVVCAVLLWRWWRGDYRAVVAVGLAALAVHVVEVATRGWSAYPALMALNLVLPALSAPVAWLAGQQVQHRDDSK